MKTEISHLIGLISGDGHIEPNGRINITTSSLEFANTVLRIAKKFSYYTGKVFDKTNRVWIVRIRSNYLQKELERANIPAGKKFDIVTLDFAKKFNDEEKASLIAGWLDAEGWFEWDKGSPRIRLKIKNEKARDQICELLKDLNLPTRKFKTKDGNFGLTMQGKDLVTKALNKIPLIHPNWENLKSVLGGRSSEFPGPHALHKARHNGTQ